MKRLTKIGLSILVLCAVLTSLISCAYPNPYFQLWKANRRLEHTPYTVVTSYDFFTESYGLQKVFTLLNEVKTTMQVDGNNFTTHIAYSEGKYTTSWHTYEQNFMYIDNVLYYHQEEHSLYHDKVLEKKSRVPRNERDTMMQELGGTSFTTTDFDSVVIEEKDGAFVITCTEINEEGITTLTESISEMLDGLVKKVTLDTKKISLIFIIRDGKLVEVELYSQYTVRYNYTIETIRMIINLTYDYEKEVSVNAPGNAAEYTDIPYEEFMDLVF